MENFEAIEELFYWDMQFHLLAVSTPKYIHFHKTNNGGLEQCTDWDCYICEQYDKAMTRWMEK